jgi:arylsulfatase A-like enzyme
MNVLLITADQWRGDCLSALGHACLETPTVDALAAEGTLFRRHYSQATPCGPSRASLHTGLYAMNHRSVTNGTPLDARHDHLAGALRRSGQVPTLFGYTDLSHDPRGLDPADPRLSTYESIYPDFAIGLATDDIGTAWLAHLNRHRGRELSPAEVWGGPLGTPAPFDAAESETAFLTDAFLAWLDQAQQERPWFAHLTYLKPHPPLVAPAPYHGLYHPDQVPAPVRATSPAAEGELHPWLRHKLGRPLSSSWMGKPANLEEAEVRRVRAVYYGLIREVDDHLGRIVEELGQRGDLERTLILFTADHGEMLGDHWLVGKDGFFRQAFHVPLIVRDPSASARRGQVVETFTEHVDLGATILERLDVPVPLQCDGCSLVPFLDGQTPAGWRRAAHYEHDFRDIETRVYERGLGLASDRCALAVHHGERYAYVHFNGLPALCFDLQADPDQLENIALDPARAAEVLGEAQAMLTWRMDMAERRLTGCKLTPEGPIGRL